MSLIFYDAAYPPAQPPKTDGVCFYIGGDTPHVWTKAEVDAQTARYRLPVFVRSSPPGPGATTDSITTLFQLKQYGVPTGTLVALDLETAVDVSYVEEYYQDLRASGYKLIVYGSQSTILENKNPSGLYWGADWTSIEHIHSGDQITQYRNFSSYDLSEAESNLPFWDTQPSTPPTPTPPSPPAANWQETVMNALPTIQSGMSDSTLAHWYIHRVQGIMNAVWHRGLTCDGVFGPETESSVKWLQGQWGLTADGVVGPKTWAVLISGG
jgi:peptidoglycan hydrolase-like protein with peptidoglycan-binding domain